MIRSLKKDLLASSHLSLPKRYETILAAVDGSVPSLEAGCHAVQLAKMYGAKIVALFVDSDGEYAVIPEEEWGEHAVREKRVQYGLAGLHALRQLSAEADVPCKALFVQGSVSSTIVNIAKERNADLIVVGDRGLSGIKRILLGSEAEMIVKESPLPVLVVKISR